jgi:hypothetical protein
MQAIVLTRRTMRELENGMIKPEGLIRSEVLQKDPTALYSKGYKNQKSAICKKGLALNLKAGDLVEWYDTEGKLGWSLEPVNISILKYKKLFWNSLKEIFKVAGTPIEELANEFGLITERKVKEKEKKNDMASKQNVPVVRSVKRICSKEVIGKQW